MNDFDSNNLLLKGIEEEVYTGRPNGEIVGLAHKAKAALEGFMTEPDSRNAEFASPPIRDYDDIGCQLMKLRTQFRDWLKTEGDYTLIPGATMSTGDSTQFHISDETNPYYRYIRDTYHTKVVTASAHISIGLDNAEDIIRASRLFRMEACLFLALSASSPFLDNEPTGFHSTRWAQFPHTPAYVPLFEDHAAYTRFVEESIRTGTMQNSRHLWISARPNGEAVPNDINRVELRICDRIDNPQHMIALAALMEARLWQLLDDPSIDPLEDSELRVSTRMHDLMEINDENNTAVMRDSLDATVRHWRCGTRMPVRQWLNEFIDSAMQSAVTRGFDAHLAPVREILEHGNVAMRWMGQFEKGQTVPQIIANAIKEMAAAEEAHRARAC